MNECPRVTGATIDILEAEGLAGALNLAAKVLSGEGLVKYPPQNWKRVPCDEHASKCIGHVKRTTRDGDSRLPHKAHAVCRALMALSQETAQ